MTLDSLGPNQHHMVLTGKLRKKAFYFLISVAILSCSSLPNSASDKCSVPSKKIDKGGCTSRWSTAGDLAAALKQLTELIESGQVKNADTLAAKLVLQYRQSKEIHLCYARLLRATGKLDNAICEYKLAHGLDNSLIEPLLSLGELSLDNLDVTAALRYANEAIALNPQSVCARNLRINALLQSDRLSEAQAELNEALRLNKRNPEAWYLAAQIQSKRGDFTSARRYLESAVSLNPEQTEWTVELCKILENSGDSASARKYLEHVISLKPDAIELQLLLARNLEFFAQDFNRAGRLYEKALVLDPTNMQAWAGIDRCFAKKNDLALRLKSAFRRLIND